jgi:hypothetical protein
MIHSEKNVIIAKKREREREMEMERKYPLARWKRCNYYV